MKNKDTKVSRKKETWIGKVYVYTVSLVMIFVVYQNTCIDQID